MTLYNYFVSIQNIFGTQTKGHLVIYSSRTGWRYYLVMRLKVATNKHQNQNKTFPTAFAIGNELLSNKFNDLGFASSEGCDKSGPLRKHAHATYSDFSRL